MISKKKKKISSLLVIIVVFILIFLCLSKKYLPIYLPNEEKKVVLKVNKNNNEARVFIYVKEADADKIKLELYDSEKKLLEPYITSKDEYTPKGSFFYSFILEKGKKYVIKTKNITKNIIFSKVKVTINN